MVAEEGTGGQTGGEACYVCLCLPSLMGAAPTWSSPRSSFAPSSDPPQKRPSASGRKGRSLPLPSMHLAALLLSLPPVCPSSHPALSAPAPLSPAAPASPCCSPTRSVSLPCASPLVLPSPLLPPLSPSAPALRPSVTSTATLRISHQTPPRLCPRSAVQLGLPALRPAGQVTAPAPHPAPRPTHTHAHTHTHTTHHAHTHTTRSPTHRFVLVPHRDASG